MWGALGESGAGKRHGRDEEEGRRGKKPLLVLAEKKETLLKPFFFSFFFLFARVKGGVLYIGEREDGKDASFLKITNSSFELLALGIFLQIAP